MSVEKSIKKMCESHTSLSEGLAQFQERGLIPESYKVIDVRANASMYSIINDPDSRRMICYCPATKQLFDIAEICPKEEKEVHNCFEVAYNILDNNIALPTFHLPLARQLMDQDFAYCKIENIVSTIASMDFTKKEHMFCIDVIRAYYPSALIKTE